MYIFIYLKKIKDMMVRDSLRIERLSLIREMMESVILCMWFIWI